MPLPQASERSFVTTFMAGHRRILGKSICQQVTALTFISKLWYFGLSVLKVTYCFLETEASLGVGWADWGQALGLGYQRVGFCRLGWRRKLTISPDQLQKCLTANYI